MRGLTVAILGKLSSNCVSGLRTCSRSAEFGRVVVGRNPVLNGATQIIVKMKRLAFMVICECLWIL